MAGQITGAVAAGLKAGGGENPATGSGALPPPPAGEGSRPRLLSHRMERRAERHRIGLG